MIEDSGGAGTFRGGLGVIRRTRALAPLNVHTQIERTECAPWGLAGGLEGTRNRVHIERADGSRTTSADGKIRERLVAGDTVVIETGGGGGFGNPLERDRERVGADVRAGYVSREAAQRDYGFQD